MARHDAWAIYTPREQKQRSSIRAICTGLLHACPSKPPIEGRLEKLDPECVVELCHKLRVEMPQIARPKPFHSKAMLCVSYPNSQQERGGQSHWCSTRTTGSARTLYRADCASKMASNLAPKMSSLLQTPSAAPHG